jgi:hypothetical protein
MKKRPLPLSYFILTFAFAALFISATLTGDEKLAPRKESATDHYSLVRNNQVTGKTNPADYLKGMQQVMQNAEIRSTAFDFDWDLLGPNNLGGRTRAILFDNRDTSGMTVYAGSVTGGLFKSDNGGNKWYKIGLELGNLNVSSITQAGNGDIYVGTGESFSVKKYTVLDDWGYADGLMGQGVFKSDDGINFTLLQSTKPTLNGSSLEWGYVNEISAHPANGAVVAATNTGLKFSNDGGNNWQITKTADGTELSFSSKDVKMASDGMIVAEVNNLCYVSPNGDPNNFILRSGDSTYNIPATGISRMEFAVPLTTNNIIYALAVNGAGALLNIYRSDDKGENWMVIGPGGSANFNIFNAGSTFTSGIGLYAATIEVYPDDPDHILVAGYTLWEGKKITDDGFFQWAVRSVPAANWLSPLYLWTGQHTCKFVPGDANTFFAGSNGGISKATILPEYFEYQFLNKDYIASQFYTVGWTMEKRNVMGGAQEIGTILINGAVNTSDSKRGEDIWTTQGGVPDGATGGYCAMSTIFPTAAIYSRFPHPARVEGVEYFVRRNEFGGGPDWSATMFTGDYKSKDSAFITPILLYENYEDYATKDSVGFKIVKNYPANSVVWVESNNGKRPFKYITPVALIPGDSIVVPDIITARFFIGGDGMVLMTKHIVQFNRTPEWYTISHKNNGGVEDLPQCMAYSSDANHLFVGTDKGKLFRVSNIKYAYNKETADVTSPYCVISTKRIPVYLPGTTTEISQVITSVSVDPNDDNRVIITVGNYGNNHYVYYTDNALDETPVFRSVQGDPGNGGLPQVPAYSSLIEMNPDNDLVFVGTEYGIYVTNNINAANPTWVAENNNIGGVPVFMLRQQTVRKGNDTLVSINVDTTYTIYEGVNNYGVIYGATYGRGLIALDEFQKPVGISEPGKMVDEASFQIFPNPATENITVAFETTTASKVTIDIFDFMGKQVKSVDHGTKAAGKHDIVVNCSSLPSGAYIMRLSIGNRPSSSKFIIK